MAQDLEAAGLLSNAITGLPKVAELIASIPAERRSQALAAVEQSYLKQLRTSGMRGPMRCNGARRSCSDYTLRYCDK
jgi:hypothetical protein